MSNSLEPSVKKEQALMDYDIYLTTVCLTSPDIGDLREAIPALNGHDLQTKLMPYPPPQEKHPPKPGFLGLNLAETLARELFARLAAAGAHGEVLLAAYREPQITQEQASEIAEQERLHRYPPDDYEPVRLWLSHDPRWWIFTAYTKKFRERKTVVIGSGGPLIYVDKVDGHLRPPVKR
jgi:hypothetical protein